MDDQTRRDLEKIRQREQAKRDEIRQRSLDRQVEEQIARDAEPDDLAELAEMFGPGVLKAIQNPAKWDLDPGLATDLARAAGKGQHRKVKRLTRRHRKEIQTAANKAKGGCLPALILLAMTVPTVAFGLFEALHYL